MRLPRVRERLDVLPAGARDVLHSMAVDVREPDLVVITPPARNGVVVWLDDGERVTLGWASQRGLVEGVGVVEGVERDSSPKLRIRLESSKISQRRDFVRVSLILDAEVRQTASTPVTCQTLDVSGGGMRAVVPLELVRGEVVEVTLQIPDEAPIEAEAEVLRGNAETSYAFRFVTIDSDDSERLIRMVFAAHRDEFGKLRRPA